MIISLLALLLICALVWWVINALPLPPPIRMAAIVIFAILAIVWLLQFVGGAPSLGLHGRLL